MSARLLPLAPILLLIAACSGQTAETDAPLKAAKIEAVMPADAPSRREFVGRVEARLTVDLAFQVPGRLADFPVSEGEIVPEGTLIARLETQDFERALRESPRGLPAAAVRALGRQLLDAMEYIHSNGYLHCDVKPDNAMVNPRSSHLYLMDMGLACRFGES